MLIVKARWNSLPCTLSIWQRIIYLLNYKKKRFFILRITRMKRTEIIVNIINMGVIGLAILNKSIVSYIIQNIVFFYFIIEYGVYIYYYGLSKLLKNKMLRTIFFIINILGLSVLTFLIFYHVFGTGEESDDIISIARAFSIFWSECARLLIRSGHFEDSWLILIHAYHGTW